MDNVQLEQLLFQAMDEENPEKKVKILESIVTEDPENENVQSAQYQLGELYLGNKGIEKDADKACQYLKNPADHGHATACFYYGLLLFDKGELSAFDYLCKAWRRGSEPALIRLEQYRNMTGESAVVAQMAQKSIDATYQQITEELEKGVDKGSNSLALGFYYVYELNGHQPDNLKKAQKYLQDAQQNKVFLAGSILSRTAFKNVENPDASARFNDKDKDYGVAGKKVDQELWAQLEDALRKQDKTERYQALKQIADMGDVKDDGKNAVIGRANTLVADYLHKGQGVARDDKAALQYAKKGESFEQSEDDLLGALEILAGDVTEGLSILATGIVCGDFKCSLRLAWLVNHRGGFPYKEQIEKTANATMSEINKALNSNRPQQQKLAVLLGLGDCIMLMPIFFEVKKEDCIQIYQKAKELGRKEEAEKRLAIYNTIKDGTRETPDYNRLNWDFKEYYDTREAERQKQWDEIDQREKDKKHRLTVGKVILYFIISMIVGGITRSPILFLIIFAALIIWKLYDKKKYNESKANDQNGEEKK
jgi:TPR repeat protein